MSENIRYESETSHDGVAGIRAIVEQSLGTDIPERYETLLQGIEKSSGDYVEALKEQIEAEKLLVGDLKLFFETLLDMMERAATVLDETEQAYSDGSHVLS